MVVDFGEKDFYCSQVATEVHMKLNPKALILAGLAAAGALLLASGSSTAIYEDQLLEVAVRQSFGDKAPQVAEEPLEIQALLLDYADNESLLLKARLAL
jgi:hypothetical protein